MIELLKLIVMLVDVFMNINLHFIIELFEFFLDLYLLKYDVREWENKERRTAKKRRNSSFDLPSASLPSTRIPHIRIQFSERY